MSTGANCIFEERKPGKWWYQLQKYPYGETPDYHEHGPFSSEEMAHTHLHDHYANPGGFTTLRLTRCSLCGDVYQGGNRAEWGVPEVWDRVQEGEDENATHAHFVCFECFGSCVYSKKDGSFWLTDEGEKRLIAAKAV